MMDEINQDHPVLSVSQLNQQVYYLLEQSFPSIYVKGEISNFVCPNSGHWYFSLKDENTQVRCAMFRMKNRRAKSQIENGMQVLVSGKVSLYQPRGDYQLIVDQVEEFGLGALQQAFDALKKKLEKAGLFHEKHKKLLPKIPQQIGVITSSTGAAIRDILRVLKRRMPGIPVIIYPTLVQGRQAAEKIVQQIELANQRDECDVLILARGGGSLEDLWSFNEESVAYAVYNSQIPIITGIGHQIDFTIADFVGDYRAATPSAAAEAAAPDQADLKRYVTQLDQRLIRRMTSYLEQLNQKLDWVTKRLHQTHPKKQLLQQTETLKRLERRLALACHTIVNHYRQHFEHLYARFYQHHPANLVKQNRLRLNYLSQRLQQQINQQIETQKARLQTLARTLHATSPLATLDRGYAIVKHKQTGEIIRQANDIQPGEQIITELRHFKIESTVDEVKP